jgi:hypothetical protein
MLTLALIFSLFSHAFHVSVTQIKYDEEEKTIQISTRIFLDDLELGLREYTQDQELNITDTSKNEYIQRELGEYILEKVQMWDEKDKPYELQFLGSEEDREVMWCYLEIEKVKKLKLIKISNNLLFEIWADQENIIHFRAFGKAKSARLYRGQEAVTFDWESKFNYFTW